jgi:hypothetical protein
MSTEIPSFTTELGHAGWHDHEVRGVIVFDLDTRCTAIVDLVLLTLGISTDRDEGRAVVTACAQAALNPDPRIPPMRLVRLAASHGSVLSALAASLAAMQGSYVGPSAVADAARFLHALVAEVGWGADDLSLEAALQRRLRARMTLFGYGVPGRPVDERFVWIRERLRHVTHHPRPWWGMFERLGERLSPLHRGPNLGGAIAAALLDLGCTPAQAGALACYCTLPPLLGNAYEGAEQHPAVLQRLPDSTIEYVGPAPRESPRSVAAHVAAATARSDSPGRGPVGRGDS